MKPMTFVGQTRVLNKPRNWNERGQGDCGPLPCHVHKGRIYSQWSFTWAERLKILFGKPLTLIVASQSMPPVAMEIKEVFDES